MADDKRQQAALSRLVWQSRMSMLLGWVLSAVGSSLTEGSSPALVVLSSLPAAWVAFYSTLENVEDMLSPLAVRLLGGLRPGRVLVACEVYDVVLLLAEGYGGSTSHAAVRQVRDERDLAAASPRPRAARGERTWAPASPEAKWTELLAPAAALADLDELRDSSALTPLSEWGAVKLGAVTGNNGYFTLSPSRARELGLDRRDLLRISPAGSSHLHGLSLTSRALAALGEEGRGTLLFRPRTPLSAAARHYIRAGSETGVDLAYKCRVRDPWYIVPLTAMNAEMPRLAANSARVRHLNSVHGVCLAEELRRLGTELLPLASLNSASRLSAELSGRSYGGGILKLEPGEARGWVVPSPALISERLEELRSIKASVARALRRGELSRATEMVDAALGLASAKPGSPGSGGLFAAAAALSRRRMDRGRKRGR